MPNKQKERLMFIRPGCITRFMSPGLVVSLMESASPEAYMYTRNKPVEQYLTEVTWSDRKNRKGSF